MWYFSKSGGFKPELLLLKVGSNLKNFLAERRRQTKILHWGSSYEYNMVLTWYVWYRIHFRSQNGLLKPCLFFWTPTYFALMKHLFAKDINMERNELYILNYWLCSSTYQHIHLFYVSWLLLIESGLHKSQKLNDVHCATILKAYSKVLNLKCQNGPTKVLITNCH